MDLEYVATEALPPSLDVDTLEAFTSALAGQAATALAKRSHVATLVRILEMAVLSQPRVMSLIRTPDVYLGRESVELRRALEEMGVNDAPKEIVDFCISIIRGKVVHRTTKAPTDLHFRSLLIERYSNGEDFRCRICGYEFLTTDLGADRLRVASDVGVKFGISTPPPRFRDPWKPSREDYRNATLDHIQPEAALGANELVNLRLLCGFCNRKRQIARRHLEVFAHRISAGTLAMLGDGRGQWAREAAVYFALCETPQCEVCSANPSSSELTAIPRTGDRRWTGLLPWQITVRCYSHAGF